MLSKRHEIFLEVATWLSFTKASEVLFISQPVISKHIKALEFQYKTTLFERKGNAIQLTTGAQLLLNRIRELQIIQVHSIWPQIENNPLMNKMKTIAGQILVAMVPLVYLYFVWNNLPESIPTHFNGHMEADKFGTKSDFLTALLVMALVSIGLSLLINNLNAIDPKKRYPDENSLMTKISWTVVIFISLLMLIIVFTTKNYGHANINSLFHKSIFILVAMIFTVMGKLMTNLKPNYFIGIRTPWTLEDGDNWQKTHQLASKIWFWGGLLTIALIIIIPGDYSHYIFLCTVIPIALIPLVYSFILFREKKGKGSNG